MDLSQAVVLVTGATSGFGSAIARRFHSAGARVIVSGRRAERLDALKRELGERTHTLELDVRERTKVFAAIEKLPREFVNISVLVNNAGLALGLEAAPRADLDDWDTMVDTNIKGVMYMTRAVLPGMMTRDLGHIVNMGSVAGSYPYPGGNAYGASKAFVEQFSLNLRADIVGKNIRVTSIEPGMSETEFALVRFKGDAAKAAEVYRGMQPLKAADIAEAVYWCTTQPPHVNVNRLELMPTMQAFGAFAVSRTTQG